MGYGRNIDHRHHPCVWDGVIGLGPAPMDTPMRWEATPGAVKEALLRPETVADIMATNASHRDLSLPEVIVPDIRLPHVTPYRRG
jgi:hypothetical protein